MFTRLSQLLHSALRRHQLEQPVVAAQVVEHVNRSLKQARLSDRAQAIRFRRGQVTIEVDHPATAQVVRESAARLLAGLRRDLGQANVNGFQFTTRPPLPRSPY